MKYITSVSLLGLSLLITIHAYAGDGKIPYPEDYRQWFHVKSMIIEPGHSLEKPFQGIHHIYANKKALRGLENGVFPTGSILVFDLLDYTSKDNAITEDDRKLVGVMHKDNKRYKSTGGWGFEGFMGNSNNKRLVIDKGESCFTCHASQQNHDYVFSKIRR